MEKVKERVELNEFDLIQNHVLAAHALREFVKFYQDNDSGKQGPELIYTMPILPLVFNKDASDSISKRRYIEGSLTKTLIEDKTLYAGLQLRMEKMFNQTMKSLSMALYLGLLSYDQETTKLSVKNRVKPNLALGKDYKDILSTSRRLGRWFAKLELEELLAVFKIKF